MNLDTNQYSITIKQKNDGQIRVSSVKIPPEEFLNDYWAKSEMKHEMERMLERAGMRVLKDIGVVEYD